MKTWLKVAIGVGAVAATGLAVYICVKKVKQRKQILASDVKDAVEDWKSEITTDEELDEVIDSIETKFKWERNFVQLEFDKLMNEYLYMEDAATQPPRRDETEVTRRSDDEQPEETEDASEEDSYICNEELPDEPINEDYPLSKIFNYRYLGDRKAWIRDTDEICDEIGTRFITQEEYEELDPMENETVGFLWYSLDDVLADDDTGDLLYDGNREQQCMDNWPNLTEWLLKFWTPEFRSLLYPDDKNHPINPVASDASGEYGNIRIYFYNENVDAYFYLVRIATTHFWDDEDVHPDEEDYL